MILLLFLNACHKLFDYPSYILGTVVRAKTHGFNCLQNESGKPHMFLLTKTNEFTVLESNTDYFSTKKYGLTKGI